MPDKINPVAGTNNSSGKHDNRNANNNFQLYLSLAYFQCPQSDTPTHAEKYLTP